MALHSLMRDFLKIACYRLVKLNIDCLYEKRKAGNYQDKCIFENDLKGSLKAWDGRHLSDPFGSTIDLLCDLERSPLLLTVPQLLLLENRGGAGKREEEGFSSFRRIEKEKKRNG